MLDCDLQERLVNALIEEAQEVGRSVRKAADEVARTAEATMERGTCLGL